MQVNYEKLTRNEIATLIITSLDNNLDELTNQFRNSDSQIGFFYLDEVFPEELTKAIYASFPTTGEVHLKKSIKEYKYVAAQMDKYDPLLEEVIYAFQDKRVVTLISKICNYHSVVPDENLYAGGISLMGKENYLNPHLDNSHDKDRNLWRVLNLLYYVTPGWNIENGGNLELWPEGIKEKPVTIVSKFNRLVVMATHGKSWHSVNEVKVDAIRCCISNYYFSGEPIEETDSFHVTTFRGRPEQYIKDKILQIDSSLRMAVRKVFKKGIRENPHVYKKDKN